MRWAHLRVRPIVAVVFRCRGTPACVPMYYPGGRGGTGRHVGLPLGGGENKGSHTGPPLHCITWVLAVGRPLRGVICNVLPDAVKFLFVADDPFVIIAFPELSGKRCPSV